jgi:hypothetical protein
MGQKDAKESRKEVEDELGLSKRKRGVERRGIGQEEGGEGPWEKKVKSRGRVCGSGMSWREHSPFAEMHAYSPRRVR